MFRDCSALTSLTLPDSVTHIGESAFSGCSGLTSLVLPLALVSAGRCAFKNSTSLTSVVFPLPVSGVTCSFTTWAVGSSRNRTNWQLTRLKQLRNVLRLITALTVERRKACSLDPDNSKHVFEGCTGLQGG